MQRTRRKVTVVDNTALAKGIGQRLRRARLRAGLTQSQLAEGRYTPAYISALERGLAKPSMAALNYIAERLDVPLQQFIADQNELRPLRLEADIALAAADYQTAADRYVELLDRKLDALSGAEARLGLAEALCRLDRGEEAIPIAAEAAESLSRAGRAEQAALAKYWLAYGHYQRDNLAQSRTLLAELLQQIGSGLRVAPDFRFRVLTAMANIESRTGEDERALSYLHEAGALAEQLDLRKRAVFLAGLAISYREAGDYEASVAAGLQSLALHQAAHAPIDQATLSNNLALTYLQLSSLDKAEELAASASDLALSVGEDRLLAHIRETQAQIALARGESEAARDRAQQSIELARATGNLVAEASATATLGRVAQTSGDQAKAIESYRAAVELMRRADMPARLQEAIGALAGLLTQQGDLEEANRLYSEALRIRR